MRLSQAEYRQVEEMCHGPDGREMMEFLSGLSVGRSASGFPDKLKAVAASMGWLKSSGDMTELGHAVAASCREILFWQERDRKLPFADAAPWLDASYFTGRTVAEIGSGAGAVLMSIEGAKKLIGIEPMEIYRQLGAILRARIGAQ